MSMADFSTPSNGNPVHAVGLPISAGSSEMPAELSSRRRIAKLTRHGLVH